MSANIQRVVTAALVVVPGPAETVTFVRQERGPYAGHWLLPGGKVEFGELAAEAARREAVEESGCEIGELVLTGAYDIRGSGSPGHHFIMWAYMSKKPVEVPAGFVGHHVAQVVQRPWHQMRPHPTDMPILNDTGVANYDRDMIENLMRKHEIVMTNLLTGAAYGHAETRMRTARV